MYFSEAFQLTTISINAEIKKIMISFNILNFMGMITSIRSLTQLLCHWISCIYNISILKFSFTELTCGPHWVVYNVCRLPLLWSLFFDLLACIVMYLRLFVSIRRAEMNEQNNISDISELSVQK